MGNRDASSANRVRLKVDMSLTKPQEECKVHGAVAGVALSGRVQNCVCLGLRDVQQSML